MVNAAQAAGGGAEPLPRQFGKYTLLRHLASGGMAEIFLALQRSMAGFEKLVVIKRILPSVSQDRAFIEMLLREARIAATLSHPNIVQIFDVGQVDSVYYIAMEHIHGEDIQAIVRAMTQQGLTEFPLEHTLSILLGTCAGLAYAHEKRDLNGRPLGIVHRDISPRNIVVSFTGDVKLVDFGIAKSGAEPLEHTLNGQVKGKAPYMSPEQASGREVDWRSDIFAAGVILFELTTGRRLFKGASEYETLKLIVDKDYPRPSHLRRNYPRALERIVMRALAKDRDQRYPSARAMQADLEAFARHERVPVSQVSLTQWMRALFEDKLAEQKEALQDIKQLADVLAAQHCVSLYEGATSTGTGTVGPSSSVFSPKPAPKRSVPAVAIAGLVLALGAGGLYYALRQDAALPKIEAGTPEGMLPRGTLELVSIPAGCTIGLNGTLRPETTPARFDRIPLSRPLKLTLTKEGFEVYRAEVVLTEAEPWKKLTAELKKGSVTLLLKLDPPTATVAVDGKPWTGDRTQIEGLTAGDVHQLTLSAPGFATRTLTVAAQPNEIRTLSETLVAATSGPSPSPPSSVPAKP